MSARIPKYSLCKVDPLGGGPQLNQQAVELGVEAHTVFGGDK